MKRDKFKAGLTKPCAYCGKPFRIAYKTDPHRFCSRSCGSLWKATQPSYRKALYTEARAKSISQSLTGKRLSESARGKISETLKSKGIKPPTRRGNGFGPTACELLLLNRISGAVYNYVVRTGARKGFGATRYLIDVALPDLKIAIEADGPTHLALSIKRRDDLKDAKLKELGWSVIRFKNSDIINNIESVIEQCQQLIGSKR